LESGSGGSEKMVMTTVRLISVVLLLSHPGLAVSAEDPKGSTATFSGPQVLASFIDPGEKVFVWRDVRIQLAIINGNSPIGVESIAINVPNRAGWATDQGSNSGICAGCVRVAFEPFDLTNPGEKRDLGNVYVRPGEWKTLLNDYFSFLFYRPRKEVFLVNLSYKPLADASGSSRVLSTRLEVNVSAHPVGMYVGALFGVVLATALVWCYRATKAISSASQPATAQTTTQNPTAQPVSIAPPWWLRLVRGSLASLIAIFLFQTTSDISFPVTVTVHDFYGGVLLGLFGDKVAEAIWVRI
jgi:hypothetical protein